MFEPVFEGPVEGYVKNFLKKNFWKVSKSMEFEDVMQEARLLHWELVQRYPEVDTPQWMMSLFKTSWYHHFTDLANNDTNQRVLVSECQFNVIDEDGSAYDSVISQAMGETENAGMLRMAIKQAPSEIKQVINLFLNAPSELLDLMSASWTEKGKKKVMGNQMLCQALGRKPGTDVLGEVRAYFTE